MELSAVEGRVLGCLIEQEALAPDAGPVTLNALRFACNQTTGRDPIVAYDDRTVEDTLLSLKSRGLARFVPPTGTVRTTGYRHRADQRWRMGPADLAVLAVLLLAGVQTAGEVRAQVQRLDPLIGPAEVDAVLDALAARTPQPFAARVPPQRPGEREPRWVEALTSRAESLDEAGAGRAGNGGRGGLVAGPVPAELAPSYAELVARVTELERRLGAAFERRGVGDSGGGSARPVATPAVEVRPAPPQITAGRASPGGGSDVAELADRIGDIERRLSRIEAELGALR
jgi:uncharacterized protein YceH (UPF0502 family)